MTLPARWTMPPEVVARPELPPLDFWQRLATEGVSIFGMVLDTGDPLAGDARGPRWGSPLAPASAAGVQDDAGERALIAQEFAAKLAARLRTPSAALGAVMQALRQEKRSRLAALQAEVAARRDVQAAEVLAQHYRRLAEMVARGVPVPPSRRSLDDLRQRIQVAILRNRPG